MNETPLPKDSPIVRAWEEYRQTSDYANTRRWVLHPEHRDGSLWAVFMRGWQSAFAKPDDVERLRQHVASVRRAIDADNLDWASDALRHVETMLTSRPRRLTDGSDDGA